MGVSRSRNDLGVFVSSPAEDRFWKRVREEDADGCWIWIGARSRGGYGSFSSAPGRTASAHRWAYESLRAAIPEGLQLDHLCRNRACVNPWHLEPVTNRVNILRGVGPTACNAALTHCRKGHEYTPENTIPMPEGGRRCRACRNEYHREWRRRAS